jgi:hypothetical protein
MPAAGVVVTVMVVLSRVVNSMMPVMAFWGAVSRYGAMASIMSPVIVKGETTHGIAELVKSLAAK